MGRRDGVRDNFLTRVWEFQTFMVLFRFLSNCFRNNKTKPLLSLFNFILCKISSHICDTIAIEVQFLDVFLDCKCHTEQDLVGVMFYFSSNLYRDRIDLPLLYYCRGAKVLAYLRNPIYNIIISDIFSSPARLHK